MTNEQILKKAIEKANKNGYKWHFGTVDGAFVCIEAGVCICTEKIIFSHDFAKAIFGKDTYYQQIDGKWSKNMIFNTSTLESWEFHLQAMVLEKEPLHYLKKFL